MTSPFAVYFVAAAQILVNLSELAVEYREELSQSHTVLYDNRQTSL